MIKIVILESVSAHCLRRDFVFNVELAHRFAGNTREIRSDCRDRDDSLSIIAMV
jgi:hypothetical protein